MFGIGPLEIIVIGVAGLLFVGPKRLPQLASQFGRFFVKIRRATSDIKGTIDEALQQAEKELVEEERAKIRELLEKSPETVAVKSPDSPEDSETHTPGDNL